MQDRIELMTDPLVDARNLDVDAHSVNSTGGPVRLRGRTIGRVEGP
jgi:hypothetical protein